MPATAFPVSQWHDYFMTVGGGAAALTGLVFVAMTLHLDEIINNPVHRHRARSILAGLTAVFIPCALVLMGGQSAQAGAGGRILVPLGGGTTLLQKGRVGPAGADKSGVP